MFKYSKVADADNDTRKTSFNITPDAGLRLNVETSKVKDTEDSNFNFIITPFVRYYFLKPTTKKVNVLLMLIMVLVLINGFVAWMVIENRFFHAGFYSLQESLANGLGQLQHTI